MRIELLGQGAAVREEQLWTAVTAALDRWPTVGLAVALVHGGHPPRFLHHGVADIGSGTPVTERTVFRVGSITKPMTAVAVLQLWERGLVDLDAPANDLLRTFELVPARPDLPPATVRHLLTHTAGIGYWRRWSDLRAPGLGAGVSGRSVPSLHDYYRAGVPVEIAPGTKWSYSNHGFATLGQIVEDVTGTPLDRYLREHVFDPLGMVHTDLIDSDRVRSTPATGYTVGRRGPRPVNDRPVPLLASGGARSTSADLARFVAALLCDTGGTVLRPETAALLFRPHFRTDPGEPGMGLSFELDEAGGHRTASKDGTVSGFLSRVALAPDDGLGVVVLTNTGGLDARGSPGALSDALLRLLLGLPDDPIRTDLPPRADVWAELCGWYGMDPGPLTNLFARLVFGAGVEVVVQRGRLRLRPLSLVPAMQRGFPLHPDDPDDPYVFRVDLGDVGMGSYRVVFGSSADDGGRRLDGLGLSLRQRPDARNPRRIALGVGAAAAGAAAIPVARRTRRHRRRG
jgi:CubicO group peptidase (beta-lactamase class C family)